MNFGWADVEEGAGRTTNTRVIPRILSTCQSFHGTLEHILSIVLHSCPGTALVKLIFRREDRGFLLFSPHVPPKVSFSNSCKNELWMVRWWTTSNRGFQFFSSDFPFRDSSRKPAKINSEWVDVEKEANFPPYTHTRLIPSTLLKFQSFHVSRAYSIYSFAQLSWHGTGGNDLWMVDLGFLLFSCPFPFTALYSKTCNYELWMVRSRIPSFLIPFPFQSFLLRQLQESTLVVDLGFLLFSCPFPFTVFYSKPTSMNFGW